MQRAKLLKVVPARTGRWAERVRVTAARWASTGSTAHAVCGAAAAGVDVVARNNRVCSLRLDVVFKLFKFEIPAALSSVLAVCSELCITSNGK